MIPIIHVFETNNSAVLLRLFDEYACYYDAKHGKDYNWFSSNVKENSRLYAVASGEVNLYDYQVRDLTEDMSFSADFMIVFAEYEVVDEDQWDEIWSHLSLLLQGKETVPPEWFEKPSREKLSLDSEEGPLTDEFGFVGKCCSIRPDYKKMEGFYGFQSYFIDDRDTMLYQITRPGELLPFTVVVEKFSVYGVKRLFTDIYGSSDWDYNRQDCRFDFTFLQNLWTHLGLEGEFTTELVKARVDACYPGRLGEGIAPETEPIVYRRSIENVLQSLKNKDFGIVRQIPEHVVKRRRYSGVVQDMI